MTDPDHLRISDADRHQVADLLREAAGEGRIDLDELDERLEATYAAKTAGDLVPVIADLPGAVPEVAPRPVPPQSAAPGTATRYNTSLVFMSGQDRRGVWEVGESHTAVAVMGGIDIDLRQAVFAADEVVINASAVMGAVDIVVNPYTRVTVDGVGVMGTFTEEKAKAEPALGPGSPHVRIRGIALMGAVCVTRKPMPKPKQKKRRCRPKEIEGE